MFISELKWSTKGKRNINICQQWIQEESGFLAFVFLPLLRDCNELLLLLLWQFLIAIATQIGSNKLKSSPTFNWILLIENQVGGNVFAVYNLGAVNHPIGNLVAKVNDGQYHVIRFYRNGANSSMQVDDLETQTKHPPGK